MSEESRALSIPTPHGQLVPDWWAKTFGPVCMFRTSLNLTDPADRAELLRALNEDSPGKDDFVNMDLSIVNFTIMPASRVLDGELQEWVRTILHLSNGERIAFGSMGITKSLMLVQQLDRPAPWKPPLIKRLQTRKLANGGVWCTLVDPPAKAKK